MTTPIAVLLMAYGTPRTRDEILPYYTDIRRGRPPTPEQLADLSNRYEAIGGISPLAQRTQAQRDALQAALDQQAPGQYMVTLGLKHAEPMIETAVNDLAALGVKRIIGLVPWSGTTRCDASSWASSSSGTLRMTWPRPLP